MLPIAPNFINVRLTDTDKQNYVKVADAVERFAGERMTMADIYRAGMVALAEKHNVKGVR